MRLLSQQVVDRFAFSSLPGSYFIKVMDVDVMSHPAMILLCVPSGEAQFSFSTYITVAEIDKQWVPVAWVSGPLLKILKTLADPVEAYQRVPNDIRQLIERGRVGYFIHGQADPEVPGQGP